MTRITKVTAHEVALPVSTAPYTTDGYGTKIHWNGRRSRITPKRPGPLLEYVVVRIETDDGHVGFGEAQADIGFFGNTVEGVAAAIRDYLGPQLVGRDPFHRDELLHLIDFQDQSCAISGIDLALHDLIGRALGVSVSALLGGTSRTRVPVAIEIAGGPAEQMADECLRLMAAGVRAFKAKIGGDPVRDAHALKVIRDAVGPDVSLRADANQGYTPKEGVTLCTLAERLGVGLELLEQPVARLGPCRHGVHPEPRRYADRGRRELLFTAGCIRDRAPRGGRRPQREARQGRRPAQRAEDHRHRRGSRTRLRPRAPPSGWGWRTPRPMPGWDGWPRSSITARRCPITCIRRGA